MNKFLRPIPLSALLALAAIQAVPAQDFINDQALSETFETRMAGIADAPRILTIGQVKAAIEKTTGRPIQVPPQPAPAADSPYNRAVPSVVAVGSIYKCDECTKWHSNGFATAWIVSPDGLAVTNAHVFEGEPDEIPGVLSRDGSVYPISEIVTADPAADIAIFRIDSPDREWPALPLATGAEVGDEVHVISHPQGRLWSFTQGRISRFHRDTSCENEPPVDWMGITADFAGGSSGGPVLNSRGEIVGMVSSTLTAYSDHSECKDHPERDVQMVFKDCIPLSSLRNLIKVRER